MTRLAARVLLLATLAVPACHSVDTLDAEIDLEPFQRLARTDTGCADLVNRLFLIDGAMVFRHKEGQCADASYALTLYGSTPDEVLCGLYDSIAGPQRPCRPAYKARFETILDHLDEPDLGLGAGHRVEPIPF